MAIQAVLGSLWFLPGLVTFGGAVAGTLLVYFSPSLDQPVAGQGAEEWARATLSTFAGASASVAGMVLSVTIVALSLASSQMGPRVIRLFMAQRRIQIAIGLMLGLFAFCAAALGTVQVLPFRDATYAAVGATILGVLSLAGLILFIHHLALAMQPTHVASMAFQRFQDHDRSLFPESVGHGRPEPDDWPVNAGGHVVADETGYLVAIKSQSLMEMLQEDGQRAQLLLHLGQPVKPGQRILEVWPEPTEAQQKELAKCLVFDVDRGLGGNPLDEISHLTSIGARALSPGVNDVATAQICIDYLTAAVARLLSRSQPSPWRGQEGGRALIHAPAQSRQDIIRACLAEVRVYAAPNPLLATQLMARTAEISAYAAEEGDRALVLHELDYIAESAQAAVNTERDRNWIATAHADAVRFASQASEPLPASFGPTD